MSCSNPSPYFFSISAVQRILFQKWSGFFRAKLIGQHFIVQMDDDPNHTAKTTQEFLMVKMWNILQWPNQSLNLNPIEHVS